MPDKGLWRERTALAWQRSALALAIVAALLVRAGTVIGVACGSLIAAAAAVSYARGRRSEDRPALIPALAVVTVTAAVAAAAVTLGS